MALQVALKERKKDELTKAAMVSFYRGHE